MFLLSISQNASCAEDQSDLLHAQSDRTNRFIKQGRLDQALIQALKVLDLAQKNYGNNSAGTAPFVDRLAAVYRAMGRLDDAERHLLRARDLIRNELGPNHAYMVSALNNLAGLYKEMGRYKEAERIYLQALDIQKTLPDEDKGGETGLLSNLAVLYMHISRYSDAEPLLKRVLAIAEKSAQPDWLSQRMHLSMDRQRLEWGRRMQNLANLYFNMRRYEDAEALTLKALQLYQPILGADHPEVARAKNDLGVLYTATGRYAKAEKILAEAVNSALMAYGDKPQPVVAEYYVNLAQVYQELGDSRSSLLFAEHALKIFRSTLGEGNPKTLSCLNNIAVIHINLGNYKTAEALLRGVISTTRDLLGEDDASLATAMFNLGSVLAAQGFHAEASGQFAGAIRIDEQRREDAFQILSEQQKLNYVSGMLQQVKRYLSHIQQYGPFSQQAVSEAMNSWLRWKGAVQEAQGRYGAALYRSDDPLVQQKFDALARIRRDLAAAQLFGGQVAQRSEAVRSLEREKQALEAELSRLSKGYALENMLGRIDAGRLSALLPADSVYIDFAEVTMLDFRLQMPGEPHYLAFILLPGGREPVRLVDIAERKVLDALVSSYLAEMKKKAAGLSSHDQGRLDGYATQLHSMLLKPLIPHLQGRRNLFVSPDGALNLMPLEVLKGDHGRYVAEDYQINYIASGRDLARGSNPEPAGSRQAVIIADPDFDLAQQREWSEATVRKGGQANLFSGLRFDRLPDTKQEADSIATVLKGAGYRIDSFQGGRAVEENLFGVKNPRILHIATHGYFLDTERSAPAVASRGLKVSFKTSLVEGLNRDIPNPMLRSGIVLAGANRSIGSGTDAGLVSAERVLGLRLHGTDLVTLSACETGLGDVRAGEGVFGLKRAFLLSGARTVVMSLWSVPSLETTALMTDFYTLMSQGNSKGQALRQARLNMLAKKRHPFYWGAFIMVGSPD